METAVHRLVQIKNSIYHFYVQITFYFQANPNIHVMFQELYKLPVCLQVLFHFLNLKIMKSTEGGVTASLSGTFVVDLLITATLIGCGKEGLICYFLIEIK